MAFFSRVDGAATLVACHVLASSATQLGKKKRTTCLTGTTCRSFFVIFLSLAFLYGDAPAFTWLYGNANASYVLIWTIMKVI